MRVERVLAKRPLLPNKAAILQFTLPPDVLARLCALSANTLSLRSRAPCRKTASAAQKAQQGASKDAAPANLAVHLRLFSENYTHFGWDKLFNVSVNAVWLKIPEVRCPAQHAIRAAPRRVADDMH